MQSRGEQLERGFVIGGYRIDGLISRGGMGVVYRATNLALNRIYALKVVIPELADDEMFRERFKREIRLAASLRHPNVVGIHYAGEQDGLLFVAMDFVDGTDLQEVLVGTGSLEPERAVGLLWQITSALDAAHQKGLVHRDVKPANILINVEDGGEHASLTDFGLAKRSDAVTALTAEGLVVGTVDYMSPEQITGEDTDARTDIYALGCVFFQMLTGQLPFKRGNSIATLYAHVHDPPPSLEAPLSNLFPAFGGVIETAMAKAPEDRYSSAGDFARDAAAALRGVRYTGAPTIVATGEARPTDTGEDASEPSPDAPEFTGVAVEPTGAATRPEPAPASRPPATTRARARPNDEASAAPPSASIPESTARRDSGRSIRRYRWPALALLLLAGAGIATVIALSSGKSPTAPPSQGLGAQLAPVPTNRVTAHGSVILKLRGDVATVTVHTSGLLAASPHLMHIHAEGQGKCPPAAAAHLHNGHLALSTGNGISYYGPTQVSLTEWGSTSGASPNNVDFARYPANGNIGYTRKITLPPIVATLIRDGNAVIVIHGIDYNHNGRYDFSALGVSDLDKTYPGEATAPALCGPLRMQPVAAAGGLRRPTTVYTATVEPVSAPLSTQASKSVLLFCHIAQTAVPTTAVRDPAGSAVGTGA